MRKVYLRDHKFSQWTVLSISGEAREVLRDVARKAQKNFRTSLLPSQEARFIPECPLKDHSLLAKELSNWICL